MIKRFGVVFVLVPILAVASESGERASQEARKAIEYAKSHSDRGELSADQLLSISTSGAKLLGVAQQQKKKRVEQGDKPRSLMDLVGDLFK